MVSVQLAFRIWIMCCHGQALAPWGDGLGDQLRRTPHRDPWVRGRREPPAVLKARSLRMRAAVFPHWHHTSSVWKKTSEVMFLFKDSEIGDGGWLVGGGAREGGDRGVEHRARSSSNDRDSGHNCDGASPPITMPAQSGEEKRKGWKIEGEGKKRTLGVQLCSRFTFQKSTGR